tara:strand:- start:400 stop:609 length:210 start_codon:yes stop_codon:yes gene_type:complete
MYIKVWKFNNNLKIWEQVSTRLRVGTEAETLFFRVLKYKEGQRYLEKHFFSTKEDYQIFSGNKEITTVK